MGVLSLAKYKKTVEDFRIKLSFSSIRRSRNWKHPGTGNTGVVVNISFGFGTAASGVARPKFCFWESMQAYF